MEFISMPCNNRYYFENFFILRNYIFLISIVKYQEQYSLSLSESLCKSSMNIVNNITPKIEILMLCNLDQDSSTYFWFLSLRLLLPCIPALWTLYGCDPSFTLFAPPPPLYLSSLLSERAKVRHKSNFTSLTLLFKIYF